MVNDERLMVKHEHLRLRRELLGIASGAVPGLSQRVERTRLTASLSADGKAFSRSRVIVAQEIATLPTPFPACWLKSKAMRFGAPWSLPEFNSSTPTTAAGKVCAGGGARLKGQHRYFRPGDHDHTS